MKPANIYLILLLFITVESCEESENADSSTTYLVKKEIRIDAGTDTIITTYEYENNKLIEENFSDESIFTYEYNDTSVLFKIVSTDGRLYQASRIIIKNDLAIKSIVLGAENGFGELIPTGEITYYNYNSTNHLVEILTYQDTVLDSKTLNTWDSNGDLIKMELYDSESFLSPILSYEYSYYLNKTDARDYGLSFKGKNSKHLVKTESSVYQSNMLSSISYSYKFDNKGRPGTVTLTSDDASTVKTFIYE